MAPVAQRVDVAHVKAVLQPLRDIGQATGDLAGHEGLAAARASWLNRMPLQAYMP